MLKEILEQNENCVNDIKNFFKKLKVKKTILIPDEAILIGLSDISFKNALKIREKNIYIMDICEIDTIVIGKKLETIETDIEYKTYIKLEFKTFEAFDKIKNYFK